MASIKSELRKWARRKDIRARGLHQEIFAAAAFLIEDGNSEQETFDLIRAAADTVDERTIPDREILGAVRYAKRKAEGGGKTERWPTLSEEYRAEIVDAYLDKGRKLASNEATLSQDPAFYLEALYRASNLVCGGLSAFEFSTQMRKGILEYIENGLNFEYLNPSPMSSFSATNKDGKESEHCEANTGPRVYLAVEFDTGQIQEQAAVLAYLSTKLPLGLIIYSGGKSLHGWFYCPRAPDEMLKAFFADACALGADRVTWSKSQFSRFPGMTNAKTGRTQSILYYNPEFTLNGKP
tara:strand:- start:25005 stop:25889 length:885 start_codon:yes stop_codon:yes gene_type:complete